MCSEHYGNISVLVYIQVKQRNTKSNTRWVGFSQVILTITKKEFKAKYLTVEKQNLARIKRIWATYVAS